MVLDPLSIKQETQLAINIAMSGRKGPVWLDIPLDIQCAIIDESKLLPVLPEETILECNREDIEGVFNLLRHSEKPCILAGNAITVLHKEKFLKMLSLLEIPVIGASCNPDIMYWEHPLYFGSSGILGTRSGNIILQSSDVILALGCGFRYKQTGFSLENFAPRAKIIMIDIDENESKKPGLRIYKFLHADIKSFFDITIKTNTKIKALDTWINHCNYLKRYFDPFENATGKNEEPVNAYNFWKYYSKYEPEDNITVLGNNSGTGARIQNGITKKKQRTLNNINYGAMGYDIPAAIGISIASKKAVVLVTGDGSFMMNMQELQTIIHNKLAVKIVIFSNGGYAGIQETCKNYFYGKMFGCTKESGISFPNLKKLAIAFGFEYKTCATNGNIGLSLKWLFSKTNYCILEIKQKTDNPSLPKVVSRINDGISSPAALHDMYPFLNKEEIERLMKY
ncbi:hypothetical protein AGMMS50230_19830 [Spirochaetia bacterium]|nr:hypothetical protein AGMMS50230_19830 [Spirochaetia bacterium]